MRGPTFPTQLCIRVGVPKTTRYGGMRGLSAIVIHEVVGARHALYGQVGRGGEVVTDNSPEI